MARGRRHAAALSMALVVVVALIGALAGASQARVVEGDQEAGGDRTGPAPTTPTPGSDTVSRAGAAAHDGAAGVSDVDRRIWYEAQIEWRDGRAVGLPWDGSLVDGVQLPVEGQGFFTWDPVHMRLGNPDDRRWGTDELVLTILGVLDAYRAANPDAPRVGVEDLSRREGGEFGVLYGGLGHRSHQNGLDVDITYPRRDRRETGIWHPDEVDLDLAQDLVDRFVAAGAEHVFVGESLDLTGPPDVVQAIPHHDDHLHVRIPPQG